MGRDATPIRGTRLEGELLRLGRHRAPLVRAVARAMLRGVLDPGAFRFLRSALSEHDRGHPLLRYDLPGVARRLQRRPGGVRRYAAGSGRWVTIGGREGGDGERHGGSPVYVEDGRITKGHPSLTGKRVGSLHEAAAPSTHRQELKQSSGHLRASFARQARQHGVEPKALHQLASEIMAHDAAFVADRTRVLRRARELSKRLGYGDLTAIKARNAGGRIDSDSVRGLDDVAGRVAEEFPGVLGSDPRERLFDLLVAGNPEPVTEREAYEQALGVLEARDSSADQWEPSDEPIPYARRVADPHPTHDVIPGDHPDAPARYVKFAVKHHGTPGSPREVYQVHAYEARSVTPGGPPTWAPLGRFPGLHPASAKMRLGHGGLPDFRDVHLRPLDEGELSHHRQLTEGADEADWRPNEAIPEDFYAYRRRGRPRRGATS